MNEWIIIVIIINANIIIVIINVWLTALFCLWSTLAMADKAPTANSVQFVIMNLAIANCISFRKDSRPHGVWESQQFQNTSYTNDVFVVGDYHLSNVKDSNKMKHRKRVEYGKTFLLIWDVMGTEWEIERRTTYYNGTIRGPHFNLEMFAITCI